MYGISDTFKTALKKSHTVVSKVELWKGGVYLQDLPISDGQVTVDDQPIRRRISVAVVDKNRTLLPRLPTDPMGVVDSELRAYRGIKFVSGTTEYVPLGVFDIATVVSDDSGEGLHIRVEGFDKARRVIRARMTNEYLIPAGTNYVTAIQDLLTFRYPDIQFGMFNSTTLTTPQIVLKTGDDPWAKAQRMALEGLGCDIYFDVNGFCVCADVPDISAATSLWDYIEGSEATFLYINRSLTNEETFNHVIVTSENPERSLPLRAEAFDNNPFSPTYYLGPYGDVVDWVFSELSPGNATQATVDTIATAIYNKRLGFVELVRFNAIVNPAHEVGDTITITRANSQLVGDLYVIDKLTIPLLAERPMDASTRKRRV
jgi:hypothetical protein